MQDRIKPLATVYFLAALSLLLSACIEKEKVLKPKIISITNVDEVLPLNDSLVSPVLYQNIPDLGKLTVREFKEKFIAIVLPAVLIARHHMALERKQVMELSENESWSEMDSTFYLNQKLRFRASDITDLLNRMTTHPNSITLAQAAVESGWGSSRFFKEGNNLFGIWSYTAGEPRMPANESGVYLRRYTDISGSIEDYFVMIGRAHAYRAFRRAKVQSQEVGQLLPHLKYYSQRGKAYINQLKLIIDQNDLTRYDHFQLDPGYFVEE